jgi:ATP-binding cassette subfamily B protein
MVLEGKLTLGQLIAFRIISSYVTQPILRLSTVWQTLQELNVSFERLGDIINIKKEKEETDNENISMPKISGLLKFDNVDFNFIKSNVNSLSNINLKIEPGTFVGLAGKSGSGKSTLTKLIPRLYKPTKGIVSIDNYDVTKVDLYSLRRQIGIVPQEPLLFAGTILDNLRINNKNASDELIVKVTKRANAHDFIMKMPDGYNTQIGERGSSMSGGQRQRIAIARTLLSEPKMLILDEATSALDFESEKIIVDNLINSYRDLTVIFISHRLQTLENADLIIMMEDGKIAESGTHSELLEKKGSYSYLYNQQGK